ncbi:hypothetical protein INR49_005396 [Caranx melampygus]|nr:hypothetical protein INR49_005396 [Caranx melampygus]
MTYAQLEGLINKWSLELEDQERHFLQQATQVNAWDRMLVENGEKITSLHKEMEKVKLDQRRLNQELDFILSQQKELEDLLCPLEESVKEQSGTIYMQNADEERERTYKLAENVDAQLKRMSQDLKEIIEHLNTSSGPADTSDPLQQICKILNAHMDSLQWIDQNSVLLQRRVEEVSKLCDNQRKEQEKTFQQKHQQGQNQDACKNSHQYDPPGNSSILCHCTLWGHHHCHLQYNKKFQLPPSSSEEESMLPVHGQRKPEQRALLSAFPDDMCCVQVEGEHQSWLQEIKER